jgi:tetratricopeptide (TPR) repeat protein
MDKYSNVVKCAQIRRLVDEKNYEKALATVEELDISQIKIITDLNIIAEVYMKTKCYEEAKDVLLKVYKKSKTRRVICQLVHMLIKSGNIEEADDIFYKYALLDLKSSDRLMLRYRIDKAKGVSKAQLILLLEQLKKEEYMEEWAFELAKLYHKEGREQDCIRECSDIILWFGEGVIVDKARLLKMFYVDGLNVFSEASVLQAKEEIKKNKKIEKIEEKKRLEEINNPYEETLEEALSDELPPHFIIIGDDANKIVQETKHLAKELFNREMTSTGKVAKISAEKLNQIKLENTQEKLRHGCLFIDKAGDLTSESVKSIINMIDTFEEDIIVILGDDEKAIKWLIKKNKRIDDYFKYNIYV